MTKSTHSKNKGSIGELAVALDLKNKGCEVFIELGDNSKIDLIAIWENKPIKIQVKAFTSKNGKVSVKNTKSGPNYSFKYTTEQVDVFAVYVNDTKDIIYVSSTELCKSKTGMTFRLSETKNKQKAKIHLVDNYRDFWGASETTRKTSQAEDDIVQTTTTVESVSES